MYLIGIATENYKTVKRLTHLPVSVGMLVRTEKGPNGDFTNGIVTGVTEFTSRSTYTEAGTSRTVRLLHDGCEWEEIYGGKLFKYNPRYVLPFRFAILLKLGDKLRFSNDEGLAREHMRIMYNEDFFKRIEL